MHQHSPGLSDAIRPIDGLILHRRIPPAIKVKNVVRRRRVWACLVPGFLRFWASSATTPAHVTDEIGHPHRPGRAANPAGRFLSAPTANAKLRTAAPSRGREYRHRREPGMPGNRSPTARTCPAGLRPAEPDRPCSPDRAGRGPGRRRGVPLQVESAASHRPAARGGNGLVPAIPVRVCRRHSRPGGFARA